MSYIYPKRELKKQDVLNPEELNDDLAPAAELYSGKLDGHNFAATSLKAHTTVNPKAYYNYDYARQFCLSGLSGLHHTKDLLKSEMGIDAYQIRNDGEWSTIDGPFGTALSTTVTTGVSNLWIFAELQYIWLGWEMGEGLDSSGHHYAHSTIVGKDGMSAETGYKGSAVDAARVQFALRVDGRILEWTITGKISPFEDNYRPIKSTVERNDAEWLNKAISAATLHSSSGAHSSATSISSEPEASKFPGPVYDWVSQPTALGPAIYPVRLGAVHSVQPGKHTIEIVARRVPLADQALYDLGGATPPPDPDVCVVTNRQLLAIDLKMYPAEDSASPAGVDVIAFDTESVVSAASLGSKVNDLANAYNTVKPGCVARGAFVNNHLASAVIAKNQKTIEPSGKVSTQSLYPGDVASGFSNSASAAAVDTTGTGTGWYLINNGSGIDLKVTNPATSDNTFDLSTESIFIVLANIHVRDVVNSAGTNYLGAFGCFNIGFEIDGSATDTSTYPAGAVRFDGVSQGFVNSWQNYDYDDALGNKRTPEEDMDVALFAFIKSSDWADLGFKIRNFGVYASTCQRRSGSPSIVWKRGSISVMQLKV